MSDDRIKIFTLAHVPAALGQAWLQHLRDFDFGHPGCHFEVMADAPNVPLAEIVEMVKIEPALSFTEVIERTRKFDVRSEPLTVVVHILRTGLPLCRFTRALPVDWPPGHKWVGAADMITDDRPIAVDDLRLCKDCVQCMQLSLVTPDNPDGDIRAGFDPRKIYP